MNVISFDRIESAFNKRVPIPGVLAKTGVRRPEIVGTGIFLLGLALTFASLTGDTPSAIARWAAVGTGISLGLSMLIELNHRWENLMRADVVALFALYVLIFVEFLFPQPYFDALMGAPEQMAASVGISRLP